MKAILTILFTLFICLNTNADNFDKLLDNKWSIKMTDITFPGITNDEKKESIKDINSKIVISDVFLTFDKTNKVLKIFDNGINVETLNMKKVDTGYEVIAPNQGAPLTPKILITKKDEKFLWNVILPETKDPHGLSTPKIEFKGEFILKGN